MSLPTSPLLFCLNLCLILYASDIQNYRLNSQAVTYLCAFLNIFLCPECTILHGLPTSSSIKNKFPRRCPPSLSSLENLSNTPDSQAFSLGLESIPSFSGPPHQRQPSNYTTGLSGCLFSLQIADHRTSQPPKSLASSGLKISIYKTEQDFTGFGAQEDGRMEET